MDPDLLAVALARGDGVVSTADLARCGVDDLGVRALVRSGGLVRVRRGCFVDGPRHRSAEAADRHLLEARAALRGLNPAELGDSPRPGDHAASHLTAALAWGLPVIASDLRLIEVCRVGSGQRRLRSPVLVHGPVPSHEVVRREGGWVVRPMLMLRQVADGHGARAGIVVADAAVRAGLVSVERLRVSAGVGERPGAAAEQLPAGRLAPPGRRGERGPFRLVAELASSLSESPGESWTKLVLHGLGYQPEQQVEIRTSTGQQAGRVDFLIRELRLIVEFDGRVKYEGAAGAAALVAEKQREDRLRALGFRIVRLVWADLADPAIVARKIAQALAA
ncbi:MAG TPA: type IV toxin-antitoxin system AbiEi family antitoxin domain-containing protein [Dermatophilaceae bacterium]|nr:type IV toxin-antitoxin system AbiEi family antitoxin domain-containing protein [Dermatophilaceae bacterium]